MDIDTTDSVAAATGASRTLEALRWLARYPHGVSLDGIATDLRSPKSSTHRALGTLRAAGFVEQDEVAGPYRLSMEFVRLAFSYYESLDAHAIMQPVLEQLTRRYDAASHYGRLSGAEIVYLAKVMPSTPGVQMTSIVGGRNPAHCTGLGKALLAYELPDYDTVEKFVTTYGPLAKRTANTIVDAHRLHDELARTRSRGYAIDDEESERGIACMAVPVFLASPTQPAGAISVTTVVAKTPLPELVSTADEFCRLVRGLASTRRT